MSLLKNLVTPARRRIVVTFVISFVIMPLLSVATGRVCADELYELRIIESLRQQLAVTSRKTKNAYLNRKLLQNLYQARDYKPIWVDQQGPLTKAAYLRQVLNGVEQDGLVYENYHPDKITALWKQRLPQTLATLELVLSDALLLYSEHIQTGYQSPQTNEFYRDIVPEPVEPVSTVQHLLQAKNFQLALDNLVPPHHGYQRLRKALQHYREILLKGGWPSLPSGPSLRPGQWHSRVAVLRQRLQIDGDLEMAPTSHASYFDSALKYAVERFQVRHGLKMDGIVGPKTRAAMNVPVTVRIQQIKNNMERWRWLPRKLGQRYIMVNAAGFELSVVEEDEVLFTMGVIVGTPKRPTPILQGDVRTVIFNPTWTVPRTIIFEDLLPRQKRDPNYLTSKGIRVFTNTKKARELDPRKINWKKISADYFPFILRQDASSKNPLGRIKFQFSNSYDIYLHDTPDKRLFNKERRAFSSGCIRVQQPVRLASYLLGKDNGWSMEKVVEQLKSHKYMEISVAGKVPVYLIYNTVWVGENNGVHFRPDVYNWDPKVSKCDARP